MPHSIRTERLLIRPVTLRDAKEYWLTHNHPDFARMTGSWAYPFTQGEVCRRIREAMLAGEGEKQWLAFIEGTRLVGTGVLFDWQPGSVEIGYDVSRGCEGRGLASEGARTLCQLAFGQYRVGVIRARVSVDNPASARILGKLGFEQIGPAEMGWSAHYGRHTPLYHYRLIRERFRP
ncbi:GNAT family N-acetyltransferase [Parvularcula marina]|uniref:GNAT family N-acetyltransferase n=1 Tax=Parvularcula marina TaxID=2292771 RepID=UPI0035158D67